MIRTIFNPHGKIKLFSLHIDESAFNNIGIKTIEIESIVVETMKPTYGMRYIMPYCWHPDGYSQAIGKETWYDSGRRLKPPDWLASKLEQFSKSFTQRKEGEYETRLRDVFPVNYLGSGHLGLRVGNANLEGWIIAGGHGVVEKLGEATWKWSVPENRIEACRNVLIANGHLIVTV